MVCISILIHIFNHTNVKYDKHGDTHSSKIVDRPAHEVGESEGTVFPSCMEWVRKRESSPWLYLDKERPFEMYATAQRVGKHNFNQE